MVKLGDPDRENGTYFGLHLSHRRVALGDWGGMVLKAQQQGHVWGTRVPATASQGTGSVWKTLVVFLLPSFQPIRLGWLFCFWPVL